MPPISLTQSSNLWGEVAPSLVSTPDIFAFAESVHGTLDIPSIWLPSSEVDKLVLTVESYEEIVIEIPNEFFEAPDQVLEILDHGDDHENGHEDTFNPSSAELRRRVKRDALPSPEPGFKDFWNGVKSFSAKINPAHLWRPARGVEEIELTSTAHPADKDRNQQPLPVEQHHTQISKELELNPWEDHIYVDDIPSGEATICSSDAGSVISPAVHVPPAPPASVCGESKAPPPSPPCGRYPVFATRAEEIAYLESKHLVSGSALVQRLNELHRQELEAQKVVSNGGPMGSMSPKQPGACINVPLDGTGRNSLSANPSGRPRGSRSPMEPGKPAPGRLDPELLARFGGPKRR